MTSRVPTLDLPPRLAAVFRACGRACEHECCGIDAFDFSPLHVASHLSSSGLMMEPDYVEGLQDELRSVVAEGMALEPETEHGFVCSLSGTNQYFTRETLQDLQAKVFAALALAPQVIRYSNGLRGRQS